MITVANRIYVNPDYAEQFEERFRQRAQLVDQMPGFQANLVLRPTEPDAPYVVLSFWDSQEDFEAWTRSDAFRPGPRPLRLPAQRSLHRSQRPRSPRSLPGHPRRLAPHPHQCKGPRRPARPLEPIPT